MATDLKETFRRIALSLTDTGQLGLQRVLGEIHGYTLAPSGDTTGVKDALARDQEPGAREVPARAGCACPRPDHHTDDCRRVEAPETAVRKWGSFRTVRVRAPAVHDEGRPVVENLRTALSAGADRINGRPSRGHSDQRRSPERRKRPPASWRRGNIPPAEGAWPASPGRLRRRPSLCPSQCPPSAPGYP